MDIRQKSALVLGGASGIGRHVAQRLTQAGHRVVLADADAKTLVDTAGALGCTYAVADVREPAQLAHAVAQAAAGGTLDIAVNCVGVEGQIDFLAHQDDATLQKVMAINATGLLLALKYELRQMLRQGHGAVCSIASIYGLAGQPRWAAYCASKHAVVGATKAAALEVAHLGIRVNAVAPGPVLTPLLERATGGHPERPAGFVPMRTLGRTEDVAALVEWLCSDAARHLTGTVVPCDGGAAAQIATTPDFSEVCFNV